MSAHRRAPCAIRVPMEECAVQVRWTWLYAAVVSAALSPVASAAEEAAIEEQPSGESSKTAPDTTRRPTTRLEEVVVEADKPLSSASADVIRQKDYEVRPHDTLQEILNNTPGLIVAQHQGGGKAPQYLIRGFDADHGTDFAVFVDMLPVNLVTGAHGQGYADVNFVIPETIERLQLFKGPYFAQFGDFANAGAMNLVTKDEFAENFAYASGGFWSTQRYVLGASPRLSWMKTLLAAQVYYTNGPFDDPQNYLRYNFFAKATVEPIPHGKLTISGAAMQGNWNASGQIPLSAVEAGFIDTNPAALVPDPGHRPFDRFDAIDPTEGGRTDRENINIQFSYTPTAEDSVAAQLYFSHNHLALYSNFTLYKDTGLRFYQSGNRIVDNGGLPNPDPTLDYLPGDGIEQDESRVLFGGRASYTTNWFVRDVGMQTEVGIENRNDLIGDLALYRQVRRNRFFAVNRLGVAESSVSGYAAQQTFPYDWLRFDVGLRGDVFFFDGTNELPDQGPDPNFTSVTVRGNTTDGIVSPKANAILTVAPNTEVYLNFGLGFHSNDARLALLGKQNPALAGGLESPLTRSTGYELGVRTRQFDSLDVAAALWRIDLDDELSFSGDAGNQEIGAGGLYQPSGPTRRWGVDLELRYEPVSWLFVDYDLTWNKAQFSDTGDPIPLAPTLLMNGGVTARWGPNFSAAVRVRYLASRPANEEDTLTASGYTLVDLLARYRWRNVEAQLDLLNVSDANWREAQFADTACLLGHVGTGNCLATPGQQGTHEDPPQAIYFTPGNPFWVRGGIAMYF